MPEQHFLANAPERRVTLVGSPYPQSLLSSEVRQQPYFDTWVSGEMYAARALRAVPRSIATYDYALLVEELPGWTPMSAGHYNWRHFGSVGHVAVDDHQQFLGSWRRKRARTENLGQRGFSTLFPMVTIIFHDRA